MSDATNSLQSPERLRKHAIANLVPFFVESPDSDPTTARLAAEGMLSGYNATTPKELQLATQIIALSWASMACLRAAVAAKNLSMDDVLRLQDHAIALDRSSQKTTKLLDARRKERAKKPKAVTPENMRWDEGAFQMAINQALEKLTDANAKLAVYMASLSAGTEPPAEEKPRSRVGDQTKPTARRARK